MSELDRSHLSELGKLALNDFEWADKETEAYIYSYLTRPTGLWAGSEQIMEGMRVIWEKDEATAKFYFGVQAGQPSWYFYPRQQKIMTRELKLPEVVEWVTETLIEDVLDYQKLAEEMAWEYRQGRQFIEQDMKSMVLSRYPEFDLIIDDYDRDKTVAFCDFKTKRLLEFRMHWGEMSSHFGVLYDDDENDPCPVVWEVGGKKCYGSNYQHGYSYKRAGEHFELTDPASWPGHLEKGLDALAPFVKKSTWLR